MGQAREDRDVIAGDAEPALEAPCSGTGAEEVEDGTKRPIDVDPVEARDRRRVLVSGLFLEELRKVGKIVVKSQAGPIIT